MQHVCKTCGQAFPTFHALSVHIGKQHPSTRPAKECNPTIKNRRRDDLRVHAANGLPQCAHCGKRFYGWPQFMGHIDQHACPVLHAQTTVDHASHPKPPESAPLAVQPVFHRPEIQTLARQGKLREKGTAIKHLNLLQHCPECHQWCAGAAYISRHANKLHSQIREHQASVAAWVQARGHIQRPCEWCGEWYEARQAAHLKSCVVLWALARFHTVEDRSQRSLHDVIATDATGGC